MARGEKFHGKNCKICGSDLRYVSTWCCVKCTLIKNNRKRKIYTARAQRITAAKRAWRNQESW